MESTIRESITDTLTCKVDGSTVERLKELASEKSSVSALVRQAIEKFLLEYGESEFDRMCRALNLCDECKDLMRKYCESSHRSLEQIVRFEIWKYWGEWSHGETCGDTVQRHSTK